MAQPLVARITLPRHPASSGVARSFVLMQLGSWLDDLESMGSAQLIVSELVGNAVSHGLGESFDLVLTLTDHLLVLELEELSAELASATPAPDDAESGRGLVIVTALSATWGMRATRRGKTVWATLVVRDPLAGPDSSDLHLVGPVA